MGLKIDNVGKVCCVFIATECGVFIIWELIYQSDTKHCGIVFWNMDDGYETASYTIHQNCRKMT